MLLLVVLPLGGVGVVVAVCMGVWRRCKQDTTKDKEGGKDNNKDKEGRGRSTAAATLHKRAHSNKRSDTGSVSAQRVRSVGPNAHRDKARDKGHVGHNGKAVVRHRKKTD